MAVILVVDDEEAVRSLLQEFLEMESHEVLQAEDGEKALDVLSRKSVDLLIADMAMPKMDGLTLIHHLRQAGSWVRILATAGWGEVSLPRAMQLGADATIEKPFDLDELRALVKGLLVRGSRR